MVLRALNVAEKPSVAKSVSQILSGGQYRTREGLSQYNKVFEFTYNVNGRQVEMLMTSVTGHLMELDFDDQYRKWRSCAPVQLYDLPVYKKVPQEKMPLKRTLQREIASCQWLVLWLDCDREGENIAYEVLQVCQERKAGLDVYRAHFSALVDRDIHFAMQHLKRPNPLFSDAVDTRQEVDLRIGSSFTRFQTMLLRDQFALPFPDDAKVILSYGPCQFPTLGFVVERFWQVENHIHEDFWYIHVRYHDPQDQVGADFTWQRGRLYDHLAATVIYEMCVESPVATVIEVDGRTTRKYPPHPLNTVELQKRASRYLRIGSEHVMKVAEELYQWGFISYPRTETDKFQQGIELEPLVAQHQQHPTWGAYAARLLDPASGLWRPPGDGGHDDKAHPPIHPTRGTMGEGNWSNDHKRIYELVVRHFLACVSQPAVGEESTASIDIAGEIFKARGLMITARNYLDVYVYDRWGQSNLPHFQVGQQFTPTELMLKSGTTQPPPLLSEADLIGMMDKAGIGTDATMHDHIKKLLDRAYATKDVQTRFTPTPLGEALVMGYDAMGYELWKPYLRATMERDMRLVSDGSKTKNEVLQASLAQMKAVFADANAQKQKLLEAMADFFDRVEGGGRQTNPGEQVRTCPRCGGNWLLKTMATGRFMIGCTGYPNCREVVWLPGAINSASVADEACDTCQPGPVHKIRFLFNRGEIPPYFSADYTGCIGGCDGALEDLFETLGIGAPANAGPGVGRGRGNGPPPGGGRGAFGGAGTGPPHAGFPPQGQNHRPSAFAPQGAAPPPNSGGNCFKCGQGGHWASQCPQGGPGGAEGAQVGGQRRQTWAQQDQQRMGGGGPGVARAGGVGGRGGSRKRGAHAEEEAEVHCKCGLPCLRLVSKTERNLNRPFGKCPKQDDGCDFFEWLAEPPANASQGRGRSGPRGINLERGRTSNW